MNGRILKGSKNEIISRIYIDDDDDDDGIHKKSHHVYIYPYISRVYIFGI